MPRSRPRGRRWCSSGHRRRRQHVGWAPAAPGRHTVLDRPHRPDYAALGHGRLTRVAERCARSPCTASGSTDAGGSGVAATSTARRPTAARLGRPPPGAPPRSRARGETLVQFRAVDGAGTPDWAPGLTPTPNTARIDTHSPHLPDRRRRISSWSESRLGAVPANGVTDPTGPQPLPVPRLRPTAAPPGGPPRRAPTVDRHRQGRPTSSSRPVDKAGNVSAWTPRHRPPRLDRTPPPPPSSAGGSLTGPPRPRPTVTGGGSTDATVGRRPPTSTARPRTAADLDGPAPPVVNRVRRGRDPRASSRRPTRRATSRRGRPSRRPGSTSGSTAPPPRHRRPPAARRRGRTQPRRYPAGGATDALRRPRTSTAPPHGGTTWTTADDGGTVIDTAEGDDAGAVPGDRPPAHTSGWWAPAAAATARIDQHAPTDPTVTGGSPPARKPPP